jgi:hypothetical protein
VSAQVCGSARASTAEPTEHPLTLIWIDSREAVVVRWADGAARTERLESDVPIHHRSTGHVRHDPGIRNGGGGPPQTAGEPRRLEHLARFLEAVLQRVAESDDLLVLGPGTVRHHLVDRIREVDVRHHRERRITTEPALPLSVRQLVARVRQAAGAAPRRRTTGPHPAFHARAGANVTPVAGRRAARWSRRGFAAARGD